MSRVILFKGLSCPERVDVEHFTARGFIYNGEPFYRERPGIFSSDRLRLAYTDEKEALEYAVKNKTQCYVRSVGTGEITVAKVSGNTYSTAHIKMGDKTLNVDTLGMKCSEVLISECAEYTVTFDHALYRLIRQQESKQAAVVRMSELSGTIGSHIARALGTGQTLDTALTASQLDEIEDKLRAASLLIKNL